MEKETRKVISLGTSKAITLPKSLIDENKEAILYAGKRGILVTTQENLEFFEAHKDKLEFLLESGI